MQPLDRHWMPYRHAVRTGPAVCLKPAGLACANLQSCRVHLAPNLQAVPGTSVLSLQAWHEPQKVGIDLGTPSTLPGGSRSTAGIYPVLLLPRSTLSCPRLAGRPQFRYTYLTGGKEPFART